MAKRIQTIARNQYWSYITWHCKRKVGNQSKYCQSNLARFSYESAPCISHQSCDLAVTNTHAGPLDSFSKLHDVFSHSSQDRCEGNVMVHGSHNNSTLVECGGVMMKLPWKGVTVQIIVTIRSECSSIVCGSRENSRKACSGWVKEEERSRPRTTIITITILYPTFPHP